MRLLLLIIFSVNTYLSFTQNDSIQIKSFYNAALTNGKAYEDLRSLCKDIGPRLTGSAEAEMAIEWGKNKMEEYEFDKIYLQEILVPHWERGTKESGWIRTSKGKIKKVNLLALGGSIGTNGLIEADVVMFNSLSDLKKANKKYVNNKIVFINQHMDEQQINTFKAYGGCFAIRGYGAVESSKLGAKAVIIRSLGLPLNKDPHTGSMYYVDSIKKIPAAAISTEDANELEKSINEGKTSFLLEMDCRDFPDVTSYNVIGEIIGNKNPNNIITFGGHLDSWDTGEGAHDDGAGIVHCLEAMRIIKNSKYKPNNTLRLVFFMNEENGNNGGKSYATWAKKQKNENHIAAIESDRGGFAPRGFHCDGPEKYISLLKTFENKLKHYDLHIFEKGYGGVDIGPLKKEFEGIPLFGFVPDSQRYFDFHHAPSDIFENVNKRELELGCAAIASILYLLDQNL
ncbi:MAG: peptidase M28 family protein [Crocinitomicaceae bacterium]|nr:peptidase M28 family protein [Crocinitomicaceae bacterium]|tara:strand:+ start:45821 stop:47185 length:1365 start_codon:yes stop_codon:yes gene_type:complete